MASYLGKNIHVSIFGQSHSQAIGVSVDGLPAGERVDLDELERFLQRRAPGRDQTATPRKEADQPQILCGLVDGVTCGAPLAALIQNTNTRSLTMWVRMPTWRDRYGWSRYPQAQGRQRSGSENRSGRLP